MPDRWMENEPSDKSPKPEADTVKAIGALLLALAYLAADSMQQSPLRLPFLSPVPDPSNLQPSSLSDP